MRRILITAILALGMSACGSALTSSTSSGISCPIDGTTFAYGSCVVPPGVAGAGGQVLPGSLSKIVDASGCGLAVVPASYTLPVGTYTCNPPL